MKKLFIGLSLCRKQVYDRDTGYYHMVGEKYVHTITGFGCFPLMLPPIKEELDIDFVLDNVSGIIFTGSLSNIGSSHYGEIDEDSASIDQDRDLTVFRLLPEAIARGIPILGVCRGLQELNVAFGGSLHRQIHEVPGMLDHREIPGQEDEECYAPVHSVNLVEGGILHKAFSGRAEIGVNSLHTQAINVLGEGLVVEAIAPDGLVEAVRVKEAKGFTLAVQWHPEYHWWDYPDSKCVMDLFFNACREFSEKKTVKIIAV